MTDRPRKRSCASDLGVYSLNQTASNYKPDAYYRPVGPSQHVHAADPQFYDPVRSRTPMIHPTGSFLSDRSAMASPYSGVNQLPIRSMQESPTELRSRMPAPQLPPSSFIHPTPTPSLAYKDHMAQLVSRLAHLKRNAERDKLLELLPSLWNQYFYNPDYGDCRVTIEQRPEGPERPKNPMRPGPNTKTVVITISSTVSTITFEIPNIPDLD